MRLLTTKAPTEMIVKDENLVYNATEFDLMIALFRRKQIRIMHPISETMFITIGVHGIELIDATFGIYLVQTSLCQDIKVRIRKEL